MDPKERRLRLMRFWLFGSVVIVFAAVTAYLYMFTMDIMGSLRVGLPIWGTVAVAAVLIFIGYQAWLKRQS